MQHICNMSLTRSILYLMDILFVLFWALIGSVVSLIGGLLLIKSNSKRENFVRYALPFGAGAMLATAFLVVLPEALHDQAEPISMLLWTLGGFLGFFILERLIGWFHHHHHDEVSGVRDKTHSYLVIIGDTLHNAIDGVALGAAFLVSPITGISTAIAVAAHEIPQEIGDFGVLLAKGMKARKVLLVNLASALMTVLAAMTVYIVGGATGLDTAPLMAIAAGMFIYIAAADIIPDIHERPHKEGRIQSLMLLIGVIAIGAVTFALPHEHGDIEDSHNHESSQVEY